MVNLVEQAIKISELVTQSRHVEQQKNAYKQASVRAEQIAEIRKSLDANKNSLKLLSDANIPMGQIPSVSSALKKECNHVLSEFSGSLLDYTNDNRTIGKQFIRPLEVHAQRSKKCWRSLGGNISMNKNPGSLLRPLNLSRILDFQIQ